MVGKNIRIIRTEDPYLNVNGSLGKITKNMEDQYSVELLNGKQVTIHKDMDEYTIIEKRVEDFMEIKTFEQFTR